MSISTTGQLGKVKTLDCQLEQNLNLNDQNSEAEQRRDGSWCLIICNQKNFYFQILNQFQGPPGRFHSSSKIILCILPQLGVSYWRWTSPCCAVLDLVLGHGCILYIVYYKKIFPLLGPKGKREIFLKTIRNITQKISSFHEKKE